MDWRTFLLDEVFFVNAHERLVGQSAFSGFRSPIDAGHDLARFANVNAMLPVDMIDDVFDNLGIKIVAAQLVVAMAG